jgi:hypothetical protein
MMKTSPKKQPLIKKTLKDMNGDEFAIPAADPSFGGLVIGEPVVFETNLAQPRQHQAFRSREFLAIDILGEKKSIMPIPWGFDIELTGSGKANEQKYIDVKYSLNPSADIEQMVVGESPVRVQISLRKGPSICHDNKSILRLSFSEFERLLTAGRTFVEMLREHEQKEFNSYDEIRLPSEVVIRKREPEMTHGQSTYVLLSVSLLKQNQTSNSVRPMISIREFVEDRKNEVHVATAKGIGVGLKAFYNLVFPCAFAIRKMHDAILQVKIKIAVFIFSEI